MGVLTQYAISRGQDMPYHGQEPGPAKQLFGVDKYDWSKPFNQFVLNRWNLDPGILPPAARTNAKYAIDKYVTFSHQDVKNPKKLPKQSWRVDTRSCLPSIFMGEQATIRPLANRCGGSSQIPRRIPSITSCSWWVTIGIASSLS